MLAEAKEQPHKKVSSIFSLMKGGSEADTGHIDQKAWKALGRAHKYCEDFLAETGFT